MFVGDGVSHEVGGIGDDEGVDVGLFVENGFEEPCGGAELFAVFV